MTADYGPDSIVIQIDRMLDEANLLAESAPDRETFYRQLFEQVLRAAGGSAAGAWYPGRMDNPVVVSTTGASRAFAQQLAAVDCEISDAICREAAKQVEPESGRDSQNSITAFVHPFSTTAEAVPDAAIAVFFARPIDQDSAHLFASIVEAVAEIAANYHQVPAGIGTSPTPPSPKAWTAQHRIPTKPEWARYKALVSALHENLNVRSTAVSLCNFGRSFYESDRVMLARRTGGTYRVIAATSAETINRKSDTILHLESLIARAFYRNRKPVILHDDTEIPAGLETTLQTYRDQSGGRFLMLMPVCDKKNRVTFVQVVESTGPDESNTIENQRRIVQRVQDAAQDVGSALRNASRHESIPMSGLLSALFGSAAGGWGTRLAKPVLALLIAGAIAGALLFLKRDLYVTADGMLVPAVEQVVFAGAEGTVSRVLVENGDRVRAEQPLLELKSLELESNLSRLDGQLATLRKKRNAIEAIKNGLNRDSPIWEQELARLSAEELETDQQIDNANVQRNALQNEAENLVRTSPIDGTVVTRDVQTQLANRPVRPGDALLRIVGDGNQWRSRIRVPDRRISRLTAAEKPDGIPVTLMISSQPERTFSGRIRQISRTAEIDPESGEAFVDVTIELTDEDIPELQSGTTVSASFNCGRVTLGYSLFNEFIDSVRYKFFYSAED